MAPAAAREVVCCGSRKRELPGNRPPVALLQAVRRVRWSLIDFVDSVPPLAMPRLAFVLSQSSSQNPVKRKLEEDLVTALIFEPGIDVTVIPNLYDLPKDGTGWLALTGIGGHLVVASWLFSRATRWTLDRHGIQGQEGVSLLKTAEEEEDEETAAARGFVVTVASTPLLPLRSVRFLAIRPLSSFESHTGWPILHRPP